MQNTDFFSVGTTADIFTNWKFKIPIVSVTILWLVCILFLFNSVASAQSYYSKVEKDGFELTKLVSDTVVNSGQNFTYSITFSIPPGATNVNISDQLPPSLEFISSTYVINLACSPGTAVPATQSVIPPNTRNAMYSLSGILPVASPCYVTGSFTLTVRFVPGITCNNTGARNRACISYVLNKKDGSFCTDFVNTNAIALNTWKVLKSVVNSSNQGGTCPNAIIDTIIKYQICVSKDWGINGQLNLVNGIVTDNLPAGASFVSSTCGASVSGQTITWNVGNIAVTNSYNNTCCTFSVLYPRASFPIGTQIPNSAVLLGRLGDTTGNCGQVDAISTVCSQVRGITNGQISKWVRTNSQPGCSGSYFIQICNTGNQPLSGIMIRDTLPAGITYTSLQTPATGYSALPTGWTATGGNITTLSSGTQALAPGACVTIEIKFTINSNAVAGTVIDNCVYLTADSVAKKSMCSQFTVKAAKPIPCVWKDICNQKTCYSPGDTFTYRLRVQNIGGQDLTGATITDLLDQNLVYLGNIRAYVSSNASISCGQSTDATWGVGVTPIFTSSTNKVTFNIPTIPFNCDAYGSCGQNGTTVPFYFIEFQVRVSDSSAIGSIKNRFSIAGGTLLTDTTNSNIQWMVVCANTSYWIEKEVKKAGTPASAYSSTATIGIGGTVDYRLRLQIPLNPTRLASLRHVSFIDELPRDNGLSDQFLKYCTSRGSMFGLSYVGGAGSFSSSSNPSVIPVAGSTGVLRNISTWLPPTPSFPLVGSLFLPGCTAGTPSIWTIPSATIPPSSKNNGFYFDQYAFIPSTTVYPWVEFKAKADTAGVNDSIACNSFVASAAVRHIINGGTYKDFAVAALESQAVCIKMTKQTAPNDSCLNFEDSSDANWRGCFVSDISIVNDLLYGSSTKVLRLTDDDGGSYAVNDIDFAGNWLLKGEDGCICFDYKVDWNSTVATINRKAPGIVIYGGAPLTCVVGDAATHLRAGFVGNPARPDIADNQWDHFCLPIDLCTTGGGLPSNIYGSWQIADANGIIGLVDPDSACTAWNALITNVTGIYLGTDYNSQPSELVYFDNFCWTCNDIPCNGDEIGNPTIDSVCCTGFVPIQNLSSTLSPITQIKYTVISGGQMKDIKALGACSTSSYTIPAVVYGSTTGSLNFVPFCTSSSFNLSIDVLATLSRTCIEIQVVHANGAVCIDTICINCKPNQQLRCDSMAVLPYRMPQLNQEWRRFEILNLMYPASPICSVKINITPEPLGHWTGGYAAINNPASFLMPGWGVTNSGTPLYTLINLGPGGPWNTPANNSVYFDIGIDFTNNAVYQWNITTIHCDGRECNFTGEFCAQTDPANCPGTSSTTGIITPVTLGRLIAGSVKIKGNKIDTKDSVGKIKFATFSLADPTAATMLAVTAASVNLSATSARIGRSYMTDASATVVFSEPLSERHELPVNFLLLRKDSNSTKPVKVNVIFYDGKANPISTKTIDVTGKVSSVELQKVNNPDNFEPVVFRPEPNPSSGDVSIQYWLPTAQAMTIEIHDALGQKITTIADVFGLEGYSTIQYNTASLSQGVYFIKLIAPSGISTTSFVVIH